MTIEAVSLRITSVYLVVLSTQNRHPMTTPPSNHMGSTCNLLKAALSEYVSSLCFWTIQETLIMLIWPSLLSRRMH